MKIIKANAEYTGGGIYRYTAKLDNGNYLLGNTEWDCIEVVDSDPDTTEESWYEEWFDNHRVKTLTDDDYCKALEKMLSWIITKQPKGNYSVTEIEKKLVDTTIDNMPEIYYSIVNIVDFMALSHIGWKYRKELFAILDQLLRIESERNESSIKETFDAIADANDVGGVKSWAEMVTEFKELFNRGERG